MPQTFSINGKVIFLNESGQAKIELLTGQSIEWPCELLPKDIKLGDSIFLCLETEQSMQNKDQFMAKEMLNSLLHV